jgi:adenylate cyclase
MAEASFIFADLVGFTAYTEQHGDEAAADLAERFCARVCEINDDHGAEEIKLLGDGSLIHVSDPGFAADLALHLVEPETFGESFPRVRVGVATGPAVRRGDDWFGTTVNTAARVVGEAAEGMALVTEAVRAEAVGVPGIRFVDEGEKSLRGLSRPVRLYSLERTDRVDLTHAALREGSRA